MMVHCRKREGIHTAIMMLSDRIEVIFGMHRQKQLWFSIVFAPEQMFELLNESYEAPQRSRSRQSQFKGVFRRIIVREVVTQPLDVVENASEIRVPRIGQSAAVDEAAENKISLVRRCSFRNIQLNHRVPFATAEIMNCMFRQLYSTRRCHRVW